MRDCREISKNFNPTNNMMEGRFLKSLLPKETVILIEEDHRPGEANVLPEEVIELVLQRLDVKNLQECRLVCKDWNREACRVLKPKILYRVKSKDVTNFCTSKLKATTFPNFSSVIQEEKDIALGLVISEGEAIMARESLSRFPSSAIFPPVSRLTFLKPTEKCRHEIHCAWLVSRYAENLTHITIFCDDNLHFFIRCFLSSTCSFPSLEYLNMDTIFNLPFTEVGRSSRNQRKQLIILDIIHKILSQSQGLRTLKVSGVGECTIPEFMDLPFNFQPLEHLAIVPQSLLFDKILESRPLPCLKSLLLHYRRGEWDEDLNLCTLLQPLAPTLQTLTVKYCPIFPRTYRLEEIPFFPALQFASLSCDMKLGDARWLVKMPQLKFLRVRTFDLSKKSPRERDINYSFPNLEKIRAQRVKLAEKAVQREVVMEAFHKVFPNVKCWRTEGPCKPLQEFVASDKGQALGLVVQDVGDDVPRTNPAWMCFSILLCCFPVFWVKAMEDLKKYYNNYNFFQFSLRILVHLITFGVYAYLCFNLWRLIAELADITTDIARGFWRIALAAK